MIMFALMMGLRMSVTGLRIPCRGSNSPHDLSCWMLDAAFMFAESADACGVTTVSPFLRLPFLVFEPTVPARGLAVTPALRALIKSSP